MACTAWPSEIPWSRQLSAVPRVTHADIMPDHARGGSRLALAGLVACVFLHALTLPLTLTTLASQRRLAAALKSAEGSAWPETRYGRRLQEVCLLPPRRRPPAPKYPPPPRCDAAWIPFCPALLLHGCTYRSLMVPSSCLLSEAVRLCSERWCWV